MRVAPSKEFGRRERQIMDVVYRLGRATVGDVMGRLPNPPTYSAVRAMLRYLERKGHLRHTRDGVRYVYEPTVPHAELPSDVLGTRGAMGYLLQKLRHKDVWERILRERLTEPLHLNFLSLLVWAFGSYRAKVAFDLVVRQWNAYGVLKAADHARELGINRVSVLEFGVAAGAGLMNLAEIARRVTRVTGVQFSLYGFDTGP